MRKIVLCTLITFFAISQNFAQKENFATAINYYLNINGTAKQYDTAVDQLFVMLKQQYSSKQVEDQVWADLKEEKPKAVNQIIFMLASVYRNLFTHEEINKMIDLYESPAGRQLVVDQTQLSEKQKDEITLFYGTPVGKKIIAQNKELAENTEEMSESWSKSLYLVMTGKLAEKGYTL